METDIKDSSQKPEQNTATDINLNLEQKLEALLFWKAEPVKIKKLATLLSTDDASVTVAAVTAGLDQLEQNLKGRGLSLVRDEEEVMLGTAKELSPLIEQLTKDELSRDLGKAGVETLSIVLYQGPISRADIDYIRGVNSQFILRNLLIRGLVERVDNPTDARSFLYKPTLELLSHLGVTKIADLPEYDQVRADIETFKKAEQLTPSFAPANSATIDPGSADSQKDEPQI